MYLITSPQGCDSRSIYPAEFNRFEFRIFLLVSLTKVEETNLLYYLFIAGEGIIGIIYFPMVLV